ncbi:MAG: CHASE2 domain-containing protein, partial [Bacteroidota bacterium]
MRSFHAPHKRRKVISLILIWFFSAGLGTVFHLTDVLAPAERLLLDHKFLLFQREYERDDIALIAVDASSLDRFSSEFNLYWPWPREMYGMLLDYLNEAGARTVTFDILFDRPDIDRLDTEGPVSDRRFAESIYSSDNVVLAINSVPATGEDSASGKSMPSGNLLQDIYRHAIPLKNRHPDIPPMRPVNIPITPIQLAARQLGSAYVPTRHDGVIRNTYLLMPAAGGVEEGLHIPSLPMAVWLTGTGPPPQKLPDFSNGRLHIHNRSIPLQPDGTYRINW